MIKLKKTLRLYHLSPYNLDGKVIFPSVPDNFFTENGYEDNVIRRVCFTEYIEGCLRGLSQNLKGREYYVHIPQGSYEVYEPSVKEVPDAEVTGELWICQPVLLKCVGRIRVIRDTGEEGIPFRYGDNTAELYDWEYKWLSRFN